MNLLPAECTRCRSGHGALRFAVPGLSMVWSHAFRWPDPRISYQPWLGGTTALAVAGWNDVLSAATHNGLPCARPGRFTAEAAKEDQGASYRADERAGRNGGNAIQHGTVQASAHRPHRRPEGSGQPQHGRVCAGRANRHVSIRHRELAPASGRGSPAQRDHQDAPAGQRLPLLDPDEPGHAQDRADSQQRHALIEARRPGLRVEHSAGDQVGQPDAGHIDAHIKRRHLAEHHTRPSPARDAV